MDFFVGETGPQNYMECWTTRIRKFKIRKCRLRITREIKDRKYCFPVDLNRQFLKVTVEWLSIISKKRSWQISLLASISLTSSQWLSSGKLSNRPLKDFGARRRAFCGMTSLIKRKMLSEESNVIINSSSTFLYKLLQGEWNRLFGWSRLRDALRLVWSYAESNNSLDRSSGVEQLVGMGRLCL